MCGSFALQMTSSYGKWVKELNVTPSRSFRCVVTVFWTLPWGSVMSVSLSVPPLHHRPSLSDSPPQMAIPDGNPQTSLARLALICLVGPSPNHHLYLSQKRSKQPPACWRTIPVPHTLTIFSTPIFRLMGWSSFCKLWLPLAQTERVSFIMILIVRYALTSFKQWFDVFCRGSSKCCSGYLFHYCTWKVKEWRINSQVPCWAQRTPF